MHQNTINHSYAHEKRLLCMHSQLFEHKHTIAILQLYRRCISTQESLSPTSKNGRNEASRSGYSRASDTIQSHPFLPLLLLSDLFASFAFLNWLPLDNFERANQPLASAWSCIAKNFRLVCSIVRRLLKAKR